MNTVPYEIIAGTVEVYQAPVGTAFPDIDGVPGASWTKVGTSGSLNYLDSDGVKVDHSQTLAFFRALGDCGSRKVFRTEEDFKIGLTMADLTLEQYANALNGNAVTTDAGGAGVAASKKLGLSRGFPVDTVALLVRIPFSPYVADGNTQFECPRAAQTGNPTPVFKKGEPAALALEWTALVDPDATSDDERFGRLICQTAEATS